MRKKRSNACGRSSGARPGPSSSTASTSGGNLLQGAETIPYTFSSTSGGAGSGLGSGNDKTLAVTVSVAQSGAANVTPGTYSDTIVVNVSP